MHITVSEIQYKIDKDISNRGYDALDSSSTSLKYIA